MSATNYVTYTGDGSTDTFTVTFDFLRQEDLKVYIDGVETSFTMDGSDVILASPPDPGAVVLIQRETVMTEPYATFIDGSGWLADDLNGAILQALYAAQDAHIRIDGISSVGGGGGNGGGSSIVPTPSAANRFLVSQAVGGGYEYALKTVTEVQTLLGITSPVSVPPPEAGHKLLWTSLATNTYDLKDISESKQLLGLTSPILSVGPINNRADHWLMTNSSGTGFTYASQATVRSKLGLQNAAYKNTGTAIGDVVVLQNLNGSPALPPVRGDNLLGVQKSQDYAMWEKGSTVLAMGNAFRNVTDSAVETVSPTGSWIRSVTGGVQVDTGTYFVKVEFYIASNSVGDPTDAKIVTANGAATPSSMTILNSGVTLPKGYTYSIETVIKVTASTSDLALEVKTPVGSNVTIANTRIHVWKLA